MTLIDIEMRLELEPNFIKRMKWQAQILLVKDLLTQNTPLPAITRVLGFSARWLADAERILEYWEITKHAPSFHQAAITANMRRTQERRAKMEKIASEATSSPRTILS